MLSRVFLVTILASAGVAQAQNDWIAPKSGDARAPCPLLNTLANHGYLPHDGKNISVPDLISAMDAALNLRADAKLFFTLQGNKAVTASSTGNKNTFHLSDLNKHDLIEHDGSLSRADLAVTGDNWSFNSSIFTETMSYWPSDTISVRDGATALLRRQDSAKKVNPQYELPLEGYTNALGQTAMYLGLFGDYSHGNARKDWVEYFFENEKFPTELGWARRSDDDQITAVGILELTTQVAVNYLAVKIGL